MGEIEDVVRDMVLRWQRDLEASMLGAHRDAVTYGHGQTLMVAGQTPSLDLIMKQIAGPWGIHTVPHHFECCQYAAAVIRDKVKAAPSMPQFGGMEVRVDTNLPLGRVRIVNSDGLVIEEFEIAADALI